MPRSKGICGKNGGRTMLAQKARAAGTAPNDNRHSASYRSRAPKSTENLREHQIERQRTQIPKLYWALYERAIGGRSRKAATHSFCLECCGWQIKEVFLCTGLACPLYPYRPHSRVTPGTSQSVSDEPESTKSCSGREWADE